MLDESRIDVYDYIYELLSNSIEEGIYLMNVPKELTEDDVKDGFIVLNIHEIADNSEFDRQTYAGVRCFIQAYVPTKSRGRVDEAKYKSFESSIDEIIYNEIDNGSNDKYTILSDGIISGDDVINTSQGNTFYIYTKSFIVVIDNIDS